MTNFSKGYFPNPKSRRCMESELTNELLSPECSLPKLARTENLNPQFAWIVSAQLTFRFRSRLGGKQRSMHTLVKIKPEPNWMLLVMIRMLNFRHISISVPSINQMPHSFQWSVHLAHVNMRQATNLMNGKLVAKDVQNHQMNWQIWRDKIRLWLCKNWK